jgi:hypothetical protein
LPQAEAVWQFKSRVAIQKPCGNSKAMWQSKGHLISKFLDKCRMLLKMLKPRIHNFIFCHRLKHCDNLKAIELFLTSGSM